MAPNFSTIDLASVTATEDAITNALQNHVTQWEQNAQDAVLKGDLVCAQQFQNWAFAADLLSKTVNIEISVLIGKILNARFGDGSGRSVAEQILDDLSIELVSSQVEHDKSIA